MEIKLYHDQRRKHRDAADSWSIYCPYPMKYRAATGIKGVFLGCKPTEEGMVRCCWMEDEIGKNIYLGKRIGGSLLLLKLFRLYLNILAKSLIKLARKTRKKHGKLLLMFRYLNRSEYKTADDKPSI